jgi:hypothetical protein
MLSGALPRSSNGSAIASARAAVNLPVLTDIMNDRNIFDAVPAQRSPAETALEPLPAPEGAPRTRVSATDPARPGRTARGARTEVINWLTTCVGG